MTDRIGAKITFNVTIHDQRALRRAAWKRTKEDRTTARDHAEFRRRVGGVEVDLLTLLDARLSPPGASIEEASVELFRLESVL